MPDVWVLQHAACETLGTIAPALAARGLAPRGFQGFAGEPIPPKIGDGTAGLIVLGGPMGVGDQERYPFLQAEMRLIADALARNVPVLGVCLGAQLLASVLGAPVTAAPQREIGWHPLTLTGEAGQDPLWAGVTSPCPMFHWHGDRFDLPPGAVSLASSALTPCQAFRCGDNVYGFQFHMEVTGEIIRDWCAAFAEELAEAGLDAADLLAQSRTSLPAQRPLADAVFGRWAALAAPD